ncbi:hypothetical protein RRG08_051739 [Elysia crispata]|uniref:Uncharacterized protein n=1 Tax=Elysia crispata TaxID=231223 RepID=A0AAE1BBI8_9GAST|nr:hypothetical protein RRG08_051739 [Elysia crispata]
MIEIKRVLTSRNLILCALFVAFYFTQPIHVKWYTSKTVAARSCGMVYQQDCGSLSLFDCQNRAQRNMQKDFDSSNSHLWVGSS